MKLIGVPELRDEKTWDDTECIVKDLVKEKLGIQEELQFERCHRVNHKPDSTWHDQNNQRILLLILYTETEGDDSQESKGEKA